MLLVELVKGSVAIPCKHSQVAYTLSMHVSEKSQPTVPDNKTVFEHYSPFLSTSVDSSLRTVTIA